MCRRTPQLALVSSLAQPAPFRTSVKSLWQVAVVTTHEAGDAVIELVQSVFGLPACSYTPVDSGEVIVSVYLQQRPRCFRPALLGGLAWIKRCGLPIGAGKVLLRRLRRQSWAESWKRHFKPIAVGSSLLIKPSWNRRKAGKGQAVVILDPGLSFGTGQHPTTAFCLRQLAIRRDREKRQSFLDIGTGSGILAIAAAKLGYSPVKAFDLDPEAVRVARANARRNRVLDKLHIHRTDLATLPMKSKQRYDLICANLIANILIEERKRIVRRLKPGGVLVLAGILRTEFTQVQRACERVGLKLVASSAEKEWRSAAFVL